MTHEDLIILTAHMAREDYDADAIAYAVAKPWKHEGVLAEAKAAAAAAL